MSYPMLISGADASKGHIPCLCGEFTFIIKGDVANRLPAGYSGEVCQRCGLYMCRVENGKRVAWPW